MKYINFMLRWCVATIAWVFFAIIVSIFLCLVGLFNLKFAVREWKDLVLFPHDCYAWAREVLDDT